MPPFVTTHPSPRSRTARAHALRQITREPHHPARPAATAPPPAQIAVTVTVHLPNDSSPDLGALRATLEHLAALGELTIVTAPAPQARDSAPSTAGTVWVDTHSRTVTRG